MAIDKEKILDIAQKYVLKGQPKKAIKEFLKLIEADPEDKRLHLKLGDVYLKSGEEDKAIEEYLKVASLYGDEDLNFRAISIYKKILSINPKLIEAFHKIAELYQKEGLAGSAKNYYQSILGIDPNNQAALKALESIEHSQEAQSGAVSSSKMESFPSMPSYAPEKKSFKGAPGSLSPSATDLSSEPEILSLDKDSEMHYHLGIAYKEMGLYDDAVSEFRIAAIDPQRRIDSLTLQGICLRDKGDFAEAEEIFSYLNEIGEIEENEIENEQGLNK